MDIESGKFKPKDKPKKRGQSLSAIMAAMKEPLEDSDDEIVETGDFGGGGPFWQLFDHLYNSASSTGMALIYGIFHFLICFILFITIIS